MIEMEQPKPAVDPEMAAMRAKMDMLEKQMAAPVPQPEPTPERKFSKLPWEKTLLYAIPVAIVALGFSYDAQGLMVHFWNTITSLAALVMMIFGVMVLVGVIQILRETKIFDRYGVATEMAVVQDRVGTDKEIPGDAKAISTKHAGLSILIGAVLLAYTLLPGG